MATLISKEKRKQSKSFNAYPDFDAGYFGILAGLFGNPKKR
jgi:hypothetical protein